jgi:phosphoglycolate phosphatase-like HAD superfamily hydrolase
MAEKIGVFLDWDGTLADTLGLIYRGMVRTVLHYGGTTPSYEAFIHTYDGRGWKDMYQSFGCPDHLSVEDLAITYRGFLEENYDSQVRLYPGAEVFLRRLADTPDIVLGILSGEQAHRIQKKLDTLQVKVDFVEGNLVEGKTSSIITCLRDYKLDPSQTLYVDDIAGHIHCGRKAEVCTVGCVIGHEEKRAQLEAAGADHVVSNYDELQKLIDGLRA